MGEIRVASGLALRPVANVVLADHAIGASHADQGAEVNKQALQPEGALVGAVNDTRPQMN